MKEKVKDIKLKLYLEGIEMPVAGVQISEQAKSAAQCTIQVPINDLALNILPRTTVHLFYKDHSTPDWLLIFEGEFSNINISRNFNNRIVSLICVGITNHWNFARKDASGFGSGGNFNVSRRVNLTFSSINDGGKIPQELKEYREINKIIGNNFIPYNSVEQILEINNLGWTIAGFSSEVIKAVENFNKNINQFLAQITSDFANTNIGYSPFHAVYQIPKRFFGIPNVEIERITKTNTVLQLLQSKIANAIGSISLIEIIIKVLDIFNYTLLAPSAPTYDKKNKCPQSFIIIPNTGTLAPLACNAIFKDEVSNTSYSRSYLQEPTRIGSILYPEIFKDPDTNTLSPFSPIVVAPSGDLVYSIYNEEDKEKGHWADIALTKKERLRGVNSAMVSNEFAQMKALVNRSKKDDDYPAFQKEMMERYTDAVYLNKVLETRQFNLIAEYSPYRIVGMPGIYIDDSSSVVGIIESVTTTISAEGRAVSNIIFKHPKILRPYKNYPILDDGSELFSLLKLSGWNEITHYELKKRYPWVDEEYKGKIKQDAKWVAKLKGDINNPEKFVFLPTWYDTKTFFPDKIGTGIYKKLMYGLDAKDKFDDDINKNLFKTQDNIYYGGIGKFRGPDDNLPFTPAADDQKTNKENTQWLSYFLKTLTDKYASVALDKKSEFIINLTRRRLVTEKEFWKFLINLKETENINNIDNIKEKSETLGKGIRSISTSIGEERGRISEVLETNKKDSSTASTPFMQERREVIRSIKNILKFRNNLVGVN